MIKEGEVGCGRDTELLSFKLNTAAIWILNARNKRIHLTGESWGKSTF